MTTTADTQHPGQAELTLRMHRPRRDVVVIHARGVLDMASEPRFAELLRPRLACTVGTVVLDLSEVSFLDTAGAVTMLEAATRARLNGKHLRVVSSSAVDRLLALIEVSDRFTYVSGFDDVLTSSQEPLRAAPSSAQIPPARTPREHESTATPAPAVDAAESRAWL